MNVLSNVELLKEFFDDENLLIEHGGLAKEKMLYEFK